MANRTFDQDSFQVIRRMVSLYADITAAGTSAPVLNRWNYPTFGGGPVARTYTAASSTPVPATSGGIYPQGYQIGAEGVMLVTRTGVGLYTLRLQDNYQRLVGLNFFIAAAAGASAVGKINEDTSISNYASPGGSLVGLAFLDFAGVAVDPTGHIRLQLILADATEP